MARHLLAVTWEGNDAWAVVAAARSGKPVVEGVLHFPGLTGDDAGGGTSGLDDQAVAIGSLAERLSRELRQLGVTKPVCLFALGRSSIEIKHLTLPPAPDDELPDMVRFQAQREFHALGTQWPLDYVPLSTAVDQPRHVLAATVSTTVIDSLEKLAGQLDSESIAHVGLRPSGAASLLVQSRKADSSAARIVVELFGDQAELTVLRGDTMLFLRSARAPSEQLDDIAGWLVSELRRTIAAVQHRLEAQQVTEIAVCAGDRSEALTAAIAEQSQITATVLDPWADAGFAKGARRPSSDGPWGALAGLLNDEAAGRRPAIDFLHPRKRPAPRNHRKQVLQAAAAVGLVAASLFGGTWFYLSSLDSDIERLRKESKALDGKVADAKKLEEQTAEIEKWAVGDTVWLEELRRLSAELPPASEAMLTKLQADATIGGGLMQLEGRVKTSPTIDAMEQKLRDDHHVVEGRGSRREDNPKYAWGFKSSIIVESPQAKAVQTKPSPTRGARPAAAKSAAAGSATRGAGKGQG